MFSIDLKNVRVLPVFAAKILKEHCCKLVNCQLILPCFLGKPEHIQMKIKARLRMRKIESKYFILSKICLFFQSKVTLV
jgi:hypothetical protein